MFPLSPPSGCWEKGESKIKIKILKIIQCDSRLPVCLTISDPILGGLVTKMSLSHLMWPVSLGLMSWLNPLLEGGPMQEGRVPCLLAGLQPY